VTKKIGWLKLIHLGVKGGEPHQGNLNHHVRRTDEENTDTNYLVFKNKKTKTLVKVTSNKPMVKL
jgi:hypothetical protein